MFEKIKTLMIYVGCILWGFGWPATFAYLIIQDYQSHPVWWKWPILIVFNLVLAAAWPIYWFIIHWLPF